LIILQSQSPQTSSSLGLLTLRRQFRDVYFSMSPLTQSEQQEKLYIILPLFLKVRLCYYLHIAWS